MLIIEASHINIGGGYSLLIELLNYLSLKKINNIVYITHKLVYYELEKEKFNTTTLIATTSLETIIRYTKKRNNIIYFSNLPPFVRNKNSVVYFHNELILAEKNFTIAGLKLLAYFYWMKLFINNTDAVACQTDSISAGLKEIGAKNILKLPFFEMLQPIDTFNKKYTFCYVCSGASHKNVERLFEAIKQILGKYDFLLAVTIENTYKNNHLIKQIENINRNAGRIIIINLGLVPKKEVLKIYMLSEALVFPSLKESLGLPLIEANMCGIKVLSSDLPFSHEVLHSPIVFNPYESKEIAKKLEAFLNGKYDNIVQKVKIKNKIKELINLII